MYKIEIKKRVRKQRLRSQSPPTPTTNSIEKITDKSSAQMADLGWAT